MGKTAVIIANGDFPKKDFPHSIIRSADFIVCCDGAVEKYLVEMNSVFGCERYPDAVVGDFDSLSQPLPAGFTGSMIRIGEQESNDLSKAFRFTVENVPDLSCIYILGAGGGREDHTIGNCSLLMEFSKREDIRERGIDIRMISDYSVAFALTDSAEIVCGKGRTFSIFTPDNTLAISSEGLEWPLDGVKFDNWWKATLNRTTGSNVRLTFSHPSAALAIIDIAPSDETGRIIPCIRK